MYTTRGNVRGCCGHNHKSIETAVKCLIRDRNGCRSQGGYSDRNIERMDREPMSRSELDHEDSVFDSMSVIE